jgi:hypothetical protein
VLRTLFAHEDEAAADTAVGGTEGVGFVVTAETGGGDGVNQVTVVVLEFGELDGTGYFHEVGVTLGATLQKGCLFGDRLQ